MLAELYILQRAGWSPQTPPAHTLLEASGTFVTDPGRFIFLMLPRLYSYYLISLLSSLTLVVQTQLSDTLWTSWVPLAVRSPYLSSWMNTTNIPFGPGVDRAPEIGPVFWNNVRLIPHRQNLTLTPATLEGHSRMGRSHTR